MLLSVGLWHTDAVCCTSVCAIEIGVRLDVYLSPIEARVVVVISVICARTLLLRVDLLLLGKLEVYVGGLRCGHMAATPHLVLTRRDIVTHPCVREGCRAVKATFHFGIGTAEFREESWRETASLLAS